MDLVKESLIKAVGFTFLMLLLGILVGLQMDELRQDRISGELREANLQTETFTVLQNYLEGSDENFCQLAEVRLPNVAERNAELGAELQRFESEDLNDQSEYEYLRERYYNNQLELYMLVNEFNDRCGETGDAILYFFDDSTESQQQGAVLDEIGQDNDNTYIFSFSKEIADNPEIRDSPVLNVLLEDYEVEEAPTLVINGEEKIEGFISQGELQNEVLQ